MSSSTGEAPVLRQVTPRVRPAGDPLGRYQLAQVLKGPSVVRGVLPVGQRDPRLCGGGKPDISGSRTMPGPYL